MGFYIRKSFSFGPFRLNFSKSGIGISVGVKGARLSTGPRGTYVHMGRHGLYYRQRIDNLRSSEPDHRQSDFSPYDFTVIETASVDELIESSNEETLAQINERIQQVAFAPFVAGIFFSAAAWIFLLSVGVATVVVAIGLLCTWMVYRGDTINRTTPLFYKLEDEATGRFATILKALETLSSADCLWRVEAKQPVWDWKRNAGAAALIHRRVIKVGCFPPPFIATNVNVWSLCLADLTMFFFPDRVLVFQGKRYGAVSYDTFQVFFSPTQFIETDRVPRDAEIVGHTWQYVRRDGGPDRRFAHNRQILVALYGLLELQSPTGLNVHLHVSRRSAAAEFAQVFSRTRQHSFYEERHDNSRARDREDSDKRRQDTKGVRDTMKEKSPYDTLGVHEGASREEISAAYRKKAQQYHPDKVASLAPEFQALAEERMKDINAAYTALKNGQWQTSSPSTTSQREGSDDDWQLFEKCRQALRRNPHDSDAHLGVGIHYYKLKEYPQAEGAFRAAVNADPMRVEPRMMLGLVSLKLGQIQAARNEYQALKRLDVEKAAQLLDWLTAEGLEVPQETPQPPSEQEKVEPWVWSMASAVTLCALILLFWQVDIQSVTYERLSPIAVSEHSEHPFPASVMEEKNTANAQKQVVPLPRAKQPPVAIAQPKPKAPVILPGRYRILRGVRLFREPRLDAEPVTWLTAGMKVQVVGSVEGKWLRVVSKHADRPPGYLRIEDAVREEQAEAAQ
jgi:tetratricopeptide (TPR) repeat protein